EMGNECKQMKSNVDITGGPGCGGNPSALKLPATFGAFGLIMGYKKLSANVYAKLMNDKSLDDISALNLSLSYTF
ncbi:MAG: hypothetical protein V4692_12810, partial [Bdellovibrionota bacterium]